MKKLRFWVLGAIVGSVLSSDFSLMALDPTWWVFLVLGFAFYAMIEYTLITPAIKDFKAFMKKRQKGKKR